MADVEVLYSVIVPVFNNEGTIDETISNLIDLSVRRGSSLEAVFVVDGSHDRSQDILESRLPNIGLRSQLIVLSRNFGAFSAIRAGLKVASGQYVAVMAADLQEPMTVVDEFFYRLETGDCDVVVGRRQGRYDPLTQKLQAQLYWFLYRRLVNPEFPRGGVDVFGCTRDVAQILSSFNEANTSLVGLLYWIGFRRSEVDYVRAVRPSGSSGWTFGRKLRYLTDSLFAFTDRPIVAVQIAGIFGILTSIIIGLLVFIAWSQGNVSDPGYTPLMLVILGSASSILLALGVIGSYVWRAYENGKARPVTLVMSREVFGSNSSETRRDLEKK